MSSTRKGLWFADPLQSMLIGSELQGIAIGDRKHDLWTTKSEIRDIVSAIWAEIVFVSICHQTNWDRLHDQIMRVAKEDPESIAPTSLRRLTPASVRTLLGDGVDESRAGLLERKRLLTSLGEAADTALPIARLELWASGEINLAGSGGIYEILNRVVPFAEDPLKKKARILIHQLLGFGLIKVCDPANVAPAVDYHLIRLYMRTNRVYPRNGGLYEKYSARRKERPAIITNLRSAVEQAMRYTAEGADLRVDLLNHVEWQIARSFCTRESPRCTGQPVASKPVEHVLESMSMRQGGCPLRSVCFAHGEPRLIRLQDPELSKSYY